MHDKHYTQKCQIKILTAWWAHEVVINSGMMKTLVVSK